MIRTYARHFLLLLAVMAFAACKKYPDGPGLSFRSKAERFVNTWKVKQVSRNAKDLTPDYENVVFTTKIDGSFDWTDKDSLGVEYTISGLWDFINEERKIRLLYTNPPVNPDRKEFEILMLKEKELWLRYRESDTVAYDWKFQP